MNLNVHTTPIALAAGILPTAAATQAGVAAALGDADYDDDGDLKHFELAVFRRDDNMTQIQP